jgi:putative ABC transport system permease protein
MTFLWLRGLVLRRPVRLMGAMTGVALGVALLVLLGGFFASGSSQMTARALATVPVDWQLEMVPGADQGRIVASLRRGAQVETVEPVGYARIGGLSATTGGSVQTTGPGVALGIEPSYAQHFPQQMRRLIGGASGVLLAQQTAANLHASVGDTIAIGRMGLPPASVRVDGIVDLPNADSLFQAIGVPSNAAPVAPPDNVVLLPSPVWHRLFDRQAIVRPDSVREQLHVRLARALPSDPAAAYDRVHRAANNVEARIAGSGVISDNLGARLLGAREDALYARVLFGFLALPGIALAVLLTIAVANAGETRRRTEQAILRMRGASTATIVWLAAAEAVVVAAAGIALGLAAAAGAWPAVGGSLQTLFGSSWAWVVIAVLAGAGLALYATVIPAWRLARSATVIAARVPISRNMPPLWARAYLDVALLATCAIAFWLTAKSGYQVVLAPEGVPQTSISYVAFLAPLCLWLGCALFMLRLGDAWLRTRGRDLVVLVRPIAGGLAGIVAAGIARRRTIVVAGAILTALAISFAVSTSVFNATYVAQARVDAQLTNGADVTVTAETTVPADAKMAELARIPGVAAADSMQHRFAYVGNDLQDLYGIDPRTIARAAPMSDAFFGGGSASKTLGALAARTDGLLLSEETVRDFDLRPGDAIRLRLQNAKDHRYHGVSFTFIGVAREFPTAPRDSFLVANAAYIGRMTGAPAREIVLLKVTGNPAVVATAARAIVADLPGAHVSDIGSAARAIGSSLTAVSLRGLAAIELVFAEICVAVATGLLLILGIAERRRTFVILWAIGASMRQLASFWWSEAGLVTLGGTVAGFALGLGVAQMLVKLLTGVFDPPPESLALPTGYLVLIVAAAIVSMLAAVSAAAAFMREPAPSDLRDL